MSYRIATSNSYSVILADLNRAQSRQIEANGQIASGKKAEDLKGYSREAQTLTAMRSVQTRVEGFISQSQVLTPRLDAQELALTTVMDASSEARQSILDALASGSGQGLKSQLESMFATASEGLNTQYNGAYLFAGGKINTAPIGVSNMASLTGGTVADAFTNDDFKITNRLDESTTLQTGVLADDVATNLVSAFRDVQAYLDANGGDFPTKLTQADTDFLTSKLTSFETARKDLTSATAANGLNQKRLENSIKTQESRKVLMTNTIGDIADVNMPDAISRLQQAQTAVEASARVFSALQASSLINFLR
jgi:flagellar hook-associated protein 3 FlgL